MMIALALGIFAAPHANARAAAPLPNPSPTATTGARSGAIPCLVVLTSGCPVSPASAPITVQVPSALVVVGANWTPGASVGVLLVPAAQPCTTPAAASAQAHASAAGVFSVVLRLPASAPNGALYALCATTADGKQSFPAAGLAAQSPLRIRAVRAPAPTLPAPTPSIDGFSLAALALAALSAGVFVLSWLRARRAKASDEP